MRDSLRKICDRFIANRDSIKSAFTWEHSYIVPICAAEFAAIGQSVDTEKMKACKALLKKSTGVFSSFRGNVALPVITKLALDSAPEEKIGKIIEIYGILKRYFSGNEYLAYVAAVLADMTEIDKVDALAARGKSIYKLMRKEHPLLTSSEDSPFAVLLAFSDKPDEYLISDMETCYTALKPVFSDGNSVQSLSHVLALAGGNVDEHIQKTVQIYNVLKNSGRKYSKYYELPVLGALAVVAEDVSFVVGDVLQADSFLANQKGYGFWGIDKKIRLMHAVMLVSNDLSAGSNISTAALTGTLTMIAAQQAATCAVIAASAATSSTAN